MYEILNNEDDNGVTTGWQIHRVCYLNKMKPKTLWVSKVFATERDAELELAEIIESETNNDEPVYMYGDWGRIDRV
jgi:hypothetical protein